MFTKKEPKQEINEREITKSDVLSFLLNRLELTTFFDIVCKIYGFESMSLEYLGIMGGYKLNINKKGFKPIVGYSPGLSDEDTYEEAKKEFERLEQLKRDIEKIVPQKKSK
jgi:hypothetical protein